MKIVKFDEKFADQMAELYANSYSEGNGKDWTVEKAKESIKVCYQYFPDYCFMALDDNGLCLGAIFSLVNPYFSGDILYVVSIQVEPKYQKSGIGKALLKKAVEFSKEPGLKGVRFLTDERKEFPKKWYEKIGFKKSGYVEYEAGLEEIKI